MKEVCKGCTCYQRVIIVALFLGGFCFLLTGFLLYVTDSADTTAENGVAIVLGVMGISLWFILCILFIYWARLEQENSETGELVSRNPVPAASSSTASSTEETPFSTEKSAATEPSPSTSSAGEEPRFHYDPSASPSKSSMAGSDKPKTHKNVQFDDPAHSEGTETDKKTN